MNTRELPKIIKRWESKEGLRLLGRLARREVRREEAFEQQALPYWERSMLRKALRAPDGFASSSGTARQRAWQLTRVAAWLDEARRAVAPKQPHVTKGRKFGGNSNHVELLKLGLKSPNEYNQWNSWRSRFPRLSPNLRGITLENCDLTHLNLDRVSFSNSRIVDCDLTAVSLKHAKFRDAHLEKVDMKGANLFEVDMRGAHLQDVRLRNANLSKAKLQHARLFDSNLNGAYLHHAELSEAVIWGTSAWRIHRLETKQQDIRIGYDFRDPHAEAAAAAFGESRPQIDLRISDIAVADFISLVANNRKDIASLIESASGTFVLLLGRFTGPQREVLLRLENALPRFGYVPIVFNFKQPKDRDLIETVSILAGLSRFVIADLSKAKSTALESQLIIPAMAVPFVPIIRENEKLFDMFSALNKYRWVLEPVRYTDSDDLMRKLKAEVIQKAEKRAGQLRRLKHPKVLKRL